MTQSYQQPQTALAGFLDSMHQDNGMSAYSLFGQYPESVAFWHDPSAPAPPTGLAAPSYPRKQSALLQPTGDQKKHKRTRSGCFTCRARRIKCDEARPTCERCRKGSRDCVYPSPTAPSTKGSRSSTKARGARPPSQGSESSSKHDTEEVSPLEPIIDEEEPEGADMGSEASPKSGGGAGHSRQQLRRTQSGHSLQKRSTKQLSEAGLSQMEPASSPSTESSRYESMSVRSGSVSHSIQDLINNCRLSEDVRFYLDFHQQNLSYDHFFLRQSSDHFIHHSILELALGYDPLLYALVGFAAYHHTVQSGGKLYTFLKYYNKALVLLRKSLEAGEEHTEATLCTVLVLTTFEEYIGDWANLVDHHQAAHALMRELLTPESSNIIELHTNIFLWYARFDVVAGILAGTETILSRDWYISKEQYDAEQAALYPDDPGKQLAYIASINRRFGLDMASLYAKLSRGLIPVDDFVAQNEQLGLTMERAKAILRQYEVCEEKVHSYPDPQPLTDEDVVDPYVPGYIWHGSMWEANFFKIDLLSTELMFKYQSMLSLKLPLLPDLQSLALQQCQLIETISRYPQRGNGYFMNFKNSIGISSMFLPSDEKHQMWARRKMALMEQNGYIIAPKFRAVLAAIWQVPEVNHWWLPNNEGFSDIIRAVRTLSEEKKNEPLDGFRENVRDMKSLFWKLSVDDEDDEQSPSSSHHSYT